MRLPRHDTFLSLPAEAPAEAIARDEALLSGQLGVLRWWTASRPAVVVGIGLHHRLAAVVDVERCARDDIEVLDRRAGGGALLLDAQMLCGAIALPLGDVPLDVTESYRWLGEVLVRALTRLDIPARAVDVTEARADVAGLRASADPVANLLLNICYGALSPYEVVIGAQKVIGLAQVRRRHAALFQFGILLRDQSPLADYLRVPDEPTRTQLRAALRLRTIGITSRSASAVAAAIADAMPSAP